jgi:predicted dehydrogenase
MSTARNEDEPLRWGIIGAGGIADTVAADIGLTAGNTVHAVAARDQARAGGFAARHGAARAYDDYAALAADPDVDVVYVATTHPNHRAHALLAIEAGKAVLIEKPVCLNAAHAREVFDAAAGRGVFAMEAMWMRCNPLVRRAQQLVAEGAIGEVRGLRHEFGLGIPPDATHRLYDRDNGGGALLDLGVYPATFAYLFLGRPDEVRTFGALASTGVDDTVSLEWLYDGEPRAQLWCSLSVDSPNLAAILGTEGWISFDPPAFRPSGLTLHNRGTHVHLEDPLLGQGTGYGPEIEEVERCVRAGLTESPLVPHADSIAILELLDDARATLGVRYPTE